MSDENEVFVYALKSLKDGSLYIGLSKDPKERLRAHNSRKTHSNRVKAPFEIIYTELCADYKAARKREKYWKSGCGRECLKKIT